MATIDGDRRVFFLGSGTASRRYWKVIRGADLPPGGSAPEEVPPAVVNARVAAALKLAPGDTLDLTPHSTGTALPARSFRVTGIAEFPFDDADAATVATDLGSWFVAHGDEARDAVDLLLVASSPDAGPAAAVSAIARARPELHVFSNEEFVARFERTDFSYFRQISFALTTVTLFFAFLLVTTLLTVSVNQRFAEIAALRALGFPRRRVAADLLWESAFMVGLGAVLALPAGGLLAGRLDAILRQIPGLPERLHFFVFDPRAVVLHLLLLAAAGLLAALYPLWIAARLPIAATLRKETVS
jgi:putative ABC transport system permease protein